MILITNPKIAGFEPRWAPFRGFSLLFDNPGAGVSPMGKEWLKVDCPINEHDHLRLYRGFAAFLEDLGALTLTNDYLFCPLPPYSYHVTVWDGLNDGNAQVVSASYRPKLDRFLGNLPDSLLTDEVFTAKARQSPLLQRTDWSVRFIFGELANWGNHAVVARLTPADPDSEKEFGWIEQERKALSAGIRERFGVEVYWPFSPHVTLGYFANEEYAARSAPQLDRWNEAVREEVTGLTIMFRGVSLYAFTDMITFIKRAPVS